MPIQFTTDLPNEDHPVLGNGVEDEVSVDRESQVTDNGDVRYQIRETGATSWDNTATGFAEQVLDFDTLTTIFTGREDGEEYEVRGRIETDDVTGTYTTPVSITTFFPAITNLQGSVDQATGEITLTWTDNADNEDGIEVQRRSVPFTDDPVGAWEVRDTLAPDSETYTESVTTGRYEYRLRAFTTYAESFSATNETLTLETPIPNDSDWVVVAPNQPDSETDTPPRIERPAFDIAPLVDTANPFGDFAVFKADDRGGEIFDRYPRGERVDIYAPEQSTPRFTGYVVERRENEQQGADALEVEAYSFDQFLRRNTVTNDQTGNTLTEALADIIQTDTPVTYNAANVDVGDDQTLTRGYQGEAVENVLRDLAFKSNNEDFGVNDDLEFFFQERETVHIDRGIDNTQWFRYDIPELGKETINEVEVWFDDGEESVIVDDGTDKLDLQDSLGLPSPGTQRAELNRPLITDIADAEDIGRKYLTFRNATLSGTVTTFGLFDAEPGDTIDITIDSRGIDAEFVIAAVEYRWGVDETILTIVEKRGDVDDILSELNDSVQRVEMNSANREAPKNRITTTNATGIVAVDINADGNTPNADRFVNDGRRAVRDTWTGETPPDITTLVVGDDGTGLSRSNDALRNQTNSASVTQTLPDSTSVTFEASITQTGVQEIGLETADGRLITRATFADPVDLAGTVSVTLDVSNDDSVSRGVLTTDGQTAVRDVLADNSPTLPNAYAYGDDGTAVSETDTALGNELVEVSLDEVLIQDAATDAEWTAITPEIPDTKPVVIENGSLRVGQISHTIEGENTTDEDATGVNLPDTYSGGDGVALFDTGEFAYWDFEVDHVIENVGVQVRDDDADGAGNAAFSWTLNGTAIDELGQTGVDLTLGWSDIGQPKYDGSGSGGVTLRPEDNPHRLRVDIDNGGGAGDGYSVDVVSVYNADYEADLTFDDNNGGTGGYLDGPQLYPSLVEQSLATATTRRNITEASFISTWNDVSNNQYVELANDGTNFTRVSNAETGSATFAESNTGIDTNIGLSRYGSRTTATPQEGFNGQSISMWQLYGNPDAVFSDGISTVLTRAVIAPGTIDGETVREAGLKSDSVLLTRHEVAEFEVLAGQRISSAESNRFIGDN